MKLFMLFKHYEIEDYYECSTVKGVFLSHEDAQKAIEKMREDYIAAKKEAYKRECLYLSPENQMERWKAEQAECRKILARKQEGSNTWKKFKSILDDIEKQIVEKRFLETPTYDEWAETNWNWKPFDAEKYSIKEIESGKLYDF